MDRLHNDRSIEDLVKRFSCLGIFCVACEAFGYFSPEEVSIKQNLMTSGVMSAIYLLFLNITPKSLIKYDNLVDNLKYAPFVFTGASIGFSISSLIR